MSDDPGRPPRFPYVAALLCAGCVGAAGWTWMRYSYVWRVGPGDPEHYLPEMAAWEDRYVEMVGKSVVKEGMVNLPDEGQLSFGPVVAVYDGPTPMTSNVFFVQGRSIDPSTAEQQISWRGRLWRSKYILQLHADASRFHGASIAGLVVGAMGVFVFTLALRHWLRERRDWLQNDIHRQDAKDAKNGAGLA